MLRGHWTHDRQQEKGRTGNKGDRGKRNQALTRCEWCSSGWVQRHMRFRQLALCYDASGYGNSDWGHGSDVMKVIQKTGFIISPAVSCAASTPSVKVFIVMFPAARGRHSARYSTRSRYVRCEVLFLFNVDRVTLLRVFYVRILYSWPIKLNFFCFYILWFCFCRALVFKEMW